MEFADLHTLANQVPGWLTYREAAPELSGLRPSPRYFAGPVPARFGEWFFGDRRAPKVGVFSVQDVTLTGDRVLSWRDKYLCIPQNGIHLGVARQAETALRARVIDEEVVLLAGPAYQMYGHWLVDFQPRLHALTAIGYELGTLRYLLPLDLPPFSREWLARLGIRNEQIVWYDSATEECRIAWALIPTCLRGDGRASPLLAAAMRDFKRRLDVAPAPGGDRRIFVSRRGWKNLSRQLANAEEVEALFERRGFEVIHPEGMSIMDQVRAFSGCRIMAAEYGSALHNSIFAPAGTTVIALRGTEGPPGFLQSGLCEALAQDCAYVFGRTEIFNDNQIYVVEPGDVDSCLNAVLDM